MLATNPDATVTQAIGYKEFAAYFDGDISSYKALELFFLNFNKHISAYCTSVESLLEYFEIARKLLNQEDLTDSKVMTVAVATLSPMAVTEINCRLLLEAVK